MEIPVQLLFHIPEYYYLFESDKAFEYHNETDLLNGAGKIRVRKSENRMLY